MDRGESDWTFLNQSKSYRELLKYDQELRRSPSALNVVRTIAIHSKRGTLITADNREKAYPQLRKRQPQGPCKVTLISGKFSNTSTIPDCSHSSGTIGF